jgi:HlyD family secretion protein
VLNEGDPVKANETIVASIHPLDPPLIDSRLQAELLAARDAARSAVGIAEIELQRAETALRLAEDELARALKLFGSGIISESATERLTNQVELAKATVEAAKATIGFRRAELANADARLLQPDPLDPNGEDCCINLLAPVDGTVLAVLAKSEQAVAAGARIAEIGDTSDLEIVVDLLSSDAVRVVPGTKALVEDWGGDHSLEATVRRVDPAAFTKVSALGIEEQRVNTVLDLEQGDTRLGHGFRVFAEMIIWECGNCLQAPISALFRVGNRWNVLLVDDGRLRQKEIETGRMNDEVVEVLAGLAPDDIVVVHPADTLGDGSLVERRE